MNVITGITVFKALDAIKYYEDVFSAEVKGNIVMMDDIPGYEDSSFKGLVAHSHLVIGETNLYVNDQLSDDLQTIGRNIQMCLSVEDESVFQEMYDKLIKDSTLERDIEEEYWGAKSFSVVDPFEVVWHLFLIKQN